MIGPVHENDTRARVKAMKNMLTNPEAFSARASAELLHFEGSLMSKPPRNDTPKSTRRAKKQRLNMALVLSSLSLLAPKMPVITRPNVR